MAINYGYFRHRFDASNDPKLQRLVDDMGIIALGYYFSLLEIYGHNFSQDTTQKSVEIHRRVIANTWRKRVDSCDKVLTKLQLSDLLVYTKLKNTYLIEIPNFLKYYGSYKKTDSVKSSNKRKENKIKEKKRIHANSVSIQEIIDAFNTMIHENIPRCSGPSGNRMRKVAELIQELSTIEKWREYFDLVNKSEFLTGHSESKFKATFDWLIEFDNFLKVIEGNYDNEKMDSFEPPF